MDEEKAQAILHGLLSDAVSYVDEELSPEREKATNYYLGKPFGNEEEGRSQVVITEVRDAVQGVLPSLLEVFFGPERVVEFIPRRAEDVEAAKQASEYIPWVFQEKLGGFLKTHAVLKDGLVRKLGIFKWDWKDTTEVTAHRLEDITPEELELLGGDPEITITRAEQKTAEDGSLVFDVEFTRKVVDGEPEVWPVPPEEFLYDREARSLDEAILVGHRTEKTRGELIALGVEEKVIEEWGHRDMSLLDNEERLARQFPDTSHQQNPEAGEANAKILYVEAYVKLDYDGDGINELRKICTIGPSYKIVKNVPVDERPFALYCPDPEPHTITGQSFADRVMDMQLLGSALTRGMMDSLSMSIFPRMAYVDGQVSVADILNTEIGAPIRMAQIGAVQPLDIPFVGKEVLPILQHKDEIVERRTGQNKGAMGLDADALQSSTRQAVGAAVTAAQMQTKLLARIFAEQTLKPLFRGLLRLYVKHRPRATIMRLRNEWVPVDPRTWTADMDLEVNVALGIGDRELKIQTLQGIAEKQENLLMQLGLANPLVGLQEYRNTLARAIELMGWKDVSSFVREIPPGWQPPEPQTQQQSPEMLLAQAQIQIEQMKTQRELLIKEAELKLKEREVQLKDDRERDRQAAEIQLKIKELELKYQAELVEAQIRADIERERLTSQAGPNESGSDSTV